MKETINRIIKNAIKEKRKTLREEETTEILKTLGIKTARSRLVRTKKEGIEYAKDIKYPLVLKISSPDILHKSDANCVRGGITDESKLIDAFDEIMNNAKNYKKDAQIDGIVIQREEKRGIEVIIGGIKDEVFGASVMVGLGGIWIEVMKDVSFRLAPIKDKDTVIEMIDELKGAKLLRGFRGKEGVNLKMLVETIIKISELIAIDGIKEIDLNPLFARKDDVIAVDTRIILEG